MTARRLTLGRRSFDLGGRILIMGILNVTPDSFSDGGLFNDPGDAVARALEMREEGADIIDVGGESTRPGARPVSEDEELCRVIPVIEGIRGRCSVPITIDTYKPGVAREALDAGADGINDISGLTFAPEMLPLVAERGCAVVISHIRGTPRTMQSDPVYDDVLEEIAGFLGDRAAAAKDAGLAEDRIIVDPGIGFGKTVEHNLILIANLGRLKQLGFAVLVGASRKSFIGKLLGLPPHERLEGSLASAVVSAWNGADVLRVHDVKGTVRAGRIVAALAKHRLTNSGCFGPEA